MKKIALSLVIILALVTGFFFWFTSSIDEIIRQKIETVGSELTGTAVTVGSVELDLKEGAGTISELIIANPHGYTTSHALSLNQLTLNIGLRSLVEQKPIIIELLTINNFSANLELGESTSNLSEISASISQNVASADEKNQDNETSDPVMLNIQKLLVTGTTVSITGADQSETKTIPAISMQNLGGSQGDTPAVVSAQILTKLIEEILKEATMQTLKKAVKDKVNNAVKGVIKSLNLN